MPNEDEIANVADKWLKIAERDLLTAKQGLGTTVIVTETICYHCQQAAEKALKAFLVKRKTVFPKTHSLLHLINLCSTIDASFRDLKGMDILTDYAIEIRYPDDWYEPSLEETNEAIRLAESVIAFVKERWQ